MEVKDCIYNRRSIRKYINDKTVEKEVLFDLVKAAIMAPSGKNGQPWRFKVFNDKEMIVKISRLSIYRRWMKDAAGVIIVFLDKEESYDYIKDVQGSGAAIQNILLYAYSIGLGACWIGEILKNEAEVKNLSGVNQDRYELMAVIMLGYSENMNPPFARKELKDVLL